MTASRERINEYAADLQTLSENARADLRTVYDATAGLSANDVADVMVDAVNGLVRNYGNAAGVLAADFYNECRQLDLGETTETVIADTFDLKADDNASGYASRHLYGSDADPDAMVSYLEGYIDKTIKEAAATTMMTNADRDTSTERVRYARVPVGPTCAWCIMLASQGFVYHSMKSAGKQGLNDYHAYCDCAIVPGWGESTKIRGYDSDGMSNRVDECSRAIGGQGESETLAEMRTRTEDWLYSGKTAEVTNTGGVSSSMQASLNTLASQGIACNVVDKAPDAVMLDNDYAVISGSIGVDGVLDTVADFSTRHRMTAIVLTGASYDDALTVARQTGKRVYMLNGDTYQRIA